MPRESPIITLRDFGRGRNSLENASLLQPGQARDSLNILHHTGLTTARLRQFIDRTFAVRYANSPVLGCAEYDKTDGTKARLAKCGGNLVSFTIGGVVAPTLLTTLGDTTHIAQFAQAGNRVYVADWANKNYISDGTAAGTYELQEASPSNAAISLASAGAAVGNAVGTVYYAFTDLDPNTGMESPPCARKSVARTADQGVTVTNVSLSFASPWTQKNLYRSQVGSAVMYLLASGLTAGSFPYADVSLDTSLSTASEYHDSNGAVIIEKPEAAKHVCFHRGRIFLANLNGKPSRLRWSFPLEPTQYSNQTTAFRDIGKDDGGEITGIVSFRGSLVIFKTNDIYIMNGDDDETNFVVFKAVAAIGCIASRSITADGERAIYYLGANAVYAYDQGSNLRVSDVIQPDIDALDPTRYDNYCAGFDQNNRQYILSATPTGASTNTKTHCLNVDTKAWGRFDFAMGQIAPSCYVDDHCPIHNSASKAKVFFGDQQGYVYEISATTSGDGVASGDAKGTVTSATAGTTTCGAAAFRTTGDGLKGLSFTVVRVADGSDETVQITSNTATVVSHGGWTGAQPVAGDTVYVGAMRGILSLGRIDGKRAGIKRWHQIVIDFEKQANQTIPVNVGYTVDGDTPPTEKQAVLMNDGFRGKMTILRRATGLSPYFDILGTGIKFELLLIELMLTDLPRRLPTRQE